MEVLYTLNYEQNTNNSLIGMGRNRYIVFGMSFFTSN